MNLSIINNRIKYSYNIKIEYIIENNNYFYEDIQFLFDKNRKCLPINKFYIIHNDEQIIYTNLFDLKYNNVIITDDILNIIILNYDKEIIDIILSQDYILIFNLFDILINENNELLYK